MELFKMFDKINKTNIVGILNYNQKLFEFENYLNLFDDSLVEGDNEKRKIALEYLKNNDLKTTPEEFYDSLIQSKHSEMLTSYSVGELSKMKLFKIPNMNIGYALKKFSDGLYSELVAVHNNEPDVHKIGNELINSAINNGACYLDHFGGYLDNLYQSLGFIEYERDKYNPLYDKDGGFAKKYGKQDVVYRKHKNCG